MAFDSHANFATSFVATAPAPALTGLSLTVSAGQGALFPAAPFNCTVWPAGVSPVSTNAEIVRVTAVVGDVFTIARAQEGSTSRAITVGDQIANTTTVKVFTDIENSIIQSISAPGGVATAPLVEFSNSPSVTFGIVGQTITASAAGGGGGASINFSAGTTSNNLSAIVFADSNNVTFGLDAGTITAAIFQEGQLPVAASASNGSFAFSTLGFSNANNVTFGTSAGSIITASVGAGTQSTQPVAASASNGSFLFSTLAFSNANNVTFGTSAGSIITASVAAAAGLTNIRVSAGTTSNLLSAITFSNINGVTWGLHLSTLTASVSEQSTQAMGMYALGNTTAQSSSTTMPANLFSVSGLGNVSVGYSAGNLVISGGTVGGGQSTQPVAASASNGSFLFSTLAFSNANNITFGTSAGSIITASLNPADLGAVTLSYFDNGPIGNNLPVTNAGSRYMGVQFIMPEPISISFIRLPGRMTCQGGSLPTTSSSGSAAMAYFSSYRFGIYSNGTGASSQSLMSVASSIATSSLLNSISVAANGSHYTITHQIGFGLEGNAASFSTSYASTAASYTMASTALSNYAGTRMLDFDFANSLPAGNYWLFLAVSSATSTTDARFSNLSIFQCSTLQFYGISQQQLLIQSMGAANTEGSVVGGSFGMGSYQPGGTLPAGIPYSGISSAPSYVKHYFEFRRSA